MLRSSFEEDLMRGYLINALEEYFPNCDLIGPEIALPNQRRCDLLLKSKEGSVIGVEVKSALPKNLYSYRTLIYHYISGLKELYNGRIQFVIIVLSERDRKSLIELTSRYPHSIDVIAIDPKKFSRWKSRLGFNSKKNKSD